MNSPEASLFLAGARVVDFHGLLFLAAMGFVPFQASYDLLSGTFNYFANWYFHSGHHFNFARVSERLGRRIVSAFGELDAGPHVIDPC